MIGETLGRYKILSTFASGAERELYLAEDTARGRQVALYVLPSGDASGSSERSERLRTKIRAIAALSHPNVMAIDEFGEDRSVAYVATGFLEGQTLRQRLRESPLSPVEAVEYARQMANGLAAIHGRDILHGDLKPENVFITSAGKIKLLGLGLTEPLATERGYWSPERVEGGTAGSSSDVFSFGAILYEMLSGRAAFSGRAAVTDHSPPELGTITSVPPSLEAIVRKCLRKSAAERYASGQDVVDAIDALSEEKTTERPPVVDDEAPTRRKWKLF